MTVRAGIASLFVALVAGENALVIEQIGKVADDVRVGEIHLDERSVAKALGDATVEVTVTDADSPGKAAPIPCRITVLDTRGILMTVGAVSGKGIAVRP